MCVWHQMGADEDVNGDRLGNVAVIGVGVVCGEFGDTGGEGKFFGAQGSVEFPYLVKP